MKSSMWIRGSDVLALKALLETYRQNPGKYNIYRRHEFMSGPGLIVEEEDLFDWPCYFFRLEERQ